MKVTLTNQTKNTLTLRFKNTNIAFVNGLRRILLSEVPSLAFDIIQISKNSSVLPDDFIVHRIGLIPVIQTERDKEEIIFPSECSCESFCEKCSYKFELTRENVNIEYVDVDARHFRALDLDYSVKLQNTPLIKLAKKQKIQLDAIVRKGLAKKNAKWAAVTSVEFEYDPTNKLKHSKLWHESSVEEEWPEFQQGTVDLVNYKPDIHLKVEVNDSHAPGFVFLDAIDVLHKKLDRLIELISNENSTS